MAPKEEEKRVNEKDRKRNEVGAMDANNQEMTTMNPWHICQEVLWSALRASVIVMCMAVGTIAHEVES